MVVDQQAMVARLEAVAEWQLFALDAVWMAVDAAMIKAIQRLEPSDLVQPDLPGCWHLQGGEGDLWCCDQSLEPAPDRMRDWAVWIDVPGKPLGLMVDRTERIRSGPLVSVYSMPPILAHVSPLMDGLLLPDKTRVATILDVEQVCRSAGKDWVEPAGGSAHG